MTFSESSSRWISDDEYNDDIDNEDEEEEDANRNDVM